MARHASILAVFVAAFTVQAGRDDTQKRGQVDSTNEISPNLRPKSDKKFFGRDYPDDLRPGRIHKFDHPYPTVQDSEDYDKDYVKDENNEKGEWQAQMDYDMLKNKLMKEKAQLKVAKQKMDQEKLEQQAAAEREKAAEAASNAAEANVKDAQKALEDVDDVSGVSGASQKVEKETDDLKKCEEELAKAKADLNKVLAEVAQAQAKADAAAAAADIAEDESEAAEERESEWEKKVKSEKEELAKARKAYEKKLAEFNALKKQLDVAASKLQVVRHKEDCKGGITNCEDEVVVRNAGQFAALPSFILLLVVSMM